MEERLLRLHLGLAEVIEAHRPSVAVIEGVFAKGMRPQATILMGQTRGALLLTCSLYKLRVVTFAASSVKATVGGNGRAPKEKVRSSVEGHLRIDLPPVVKDGYDDSDALALALCYVFRQGLLR
jgi:crossover junction endodeoxyribonuclease RuvC